MQKYPTAQAMLHMRSDAKEAMHARYLSCAALCSGPRNSKVSVKSQKGLSKVYNKVSIKSYYLQQMMRWEYKSMNLILGILLLGHARS